MTESKTFRFWAVQEKSHNYQEHPITLTLISIYATFAAAVLIFFCRFPLGQLACDEANLGAARISRFMVEQ